MDENTITQLVETHGVKHAAKIIAAKTNGKKQRTLMIDDGLYAVAKDIGGGNFSRGVRKALMEHSSVSVPEFFRTGVER